jgi:hypothetical protein
MKSHLTTSKRRTSFTHESLGLGMMLTITDAEEIGALVLKSTIVIFRLFELSPTYFRGSGPIMRISPNEVSFDDIEASDIIYAQTSKFEHLHGRTRGTRVSWPGNDVDDHGC